jgi:hypothetical protein
MEIMIAVAVVVVLVFAGFFAWLHFATKRIEVHQLESLARLACRSCGRTYGMAASQTARREYIDHCDAQRKQRPDLRINFGRRWDIRCPMCGAKAQFDFETRQLVTDAA